MNLYAALCLGLIGVVTGCAQLAPVKSEVTNKPEMAPAKAVTAPVASQPPTTPTAPAAPIAARPAPPAIAAAPVAPPNPLRPFADVIKDASRTPGLFPIWKREDRVWIEIAADQFDKPFLFAAQRTTGIGERRLFAHWMLVNHIIEFRRFGANNALVQFIAKNTRFSAKDNPELERAVALSFSDSLIGNTSVVSQEHPQRKTVLIEANPLFLNDLPQLGRDTEQLFRIGYSFDQRNSYFGQMSASADQSVLEVKAHYSVPRLPTSSPLAPTLGASPPSNLADPRSFFVTYQYSLAALPSTPMAARYADDRIGHFVQRRQDWGNEQTPYQRQYIVNRWRLEKKDPSQAMSEPVKPITYWLDKNIPSRYVETVKAGVLEWNKAFEKIGFKNAITVEIEPEKNGPVLAGLRHASIRWYLDTDGGSLAIGPSITDPRTGEILDADIAISDNWVRLFREAAIETLPLPRAMHDHDHLCEHSIQALQDLQFSADILQTRGMLEPNTPQTEKLVQAVLKDVVSHEVGHTLGLRHNFRASTIVPNAKLRDPAYVAANGISGSVMDYNGINTSLESEPVTDYVMTTLGPYDYWAIEYAYRPLNPADEVQALAAIASRSNEPELAYGTDDEYNAGYDPEVNQRDLGSDPLVYAQRRFALAKELWRRLEKRQLKVGESYGVLRRASDNAFGQFEGAATIAARHIGGVKFYRDHSGSNRLPYQPIPAERQRQALNLVTQAVFSADAFQFDPNFLARLTEDGLERGFRPPSLPSINTRIAGLQRRLLDQLMGDSVALRLAEAPATLSDKTQALALSELYTMLQTSIWSELKLGQEVNAQRRNLQRDHVRRLSGLLLRSNVGLPLDSRALGRYFGLQLEGQLRMAINRDSKVSLETKAHWLESLATLQDSLKAPFVRAGS
jgi:Met-zincin/Domain of unknown function (DUF5117)